MDIMFDFLTGLADQSKLFGIKLINPNDFFELLVRFGLNTMLVFSMVHFLYTKNSNRRDFYFTFIAIGIIVFLMCFLLSSVKLEMGFALGLFAVFGILRYRTDAIPIKEMTYLFVIIGITVMNALFNKKVSYAEILFANGAIYGGMWLLERTLMLKQESSVRMVYDKIENIHLMSEEALLADLAKRTGIAVKRFEIQKIDFLRDVAEITLFFNVEKKFTTPTPRI